jgi:hypothetical protein
MKSIEVERLRSKTPFTTWQKNNCLKTKRKDHEKNSPRITKLESITLLERSYLHLLISISFYLNFVLVV